jgi:hypothetical protein
MRVEDRKKKLGNLGFELGYGLNPLETLVDWKIEFKSSERK